MVQEALHSEVRLALPAIMQEPSSIEKIMEIDEHMCCAMSGLTADAKTLIDHARAETQVGWLLTHLERTPKGVCLLSRSLLLAAT